MTITFDQFRAARVEHADIAPIAQCDFDDATFAGFAYPGYQWIGVDAGVYFSFIEVDGWDTEVRDNTLFNLEERLYNYALAEGLFDAEEGQHRFIHGGDFRKPAQSDSISFSSVAAWAIGRAELELNGSDVEGERCFSVVPTQYLSPSVTLLHLVVAFPVEQQEAFEAVLSYFRTAEHAHDIVNIDGKQWHIGDGDDSLAVEFTPGRAIIWVRHFNEEAPL